MAFSWILLRIITNNQETEPQSLENSVLGLWQSRVMYTHMRLEALQALLGCWDKEVNNYWAPCTVLDSSTCISSFGSLQRALGPSGPHFSDKKTWGSEKLSLCQVSQACKHNGISSGVYSKYRDSESIDPRWGSGMSIFSKYQRWCQYICCAKNYYSTDSNSAIFGQESHPCQYLTRQHWASYWISPSLGFYFCQMGMTIPNQ